MTIPAEVAVFIVESKATGKHQMLCVSRPGQALFFVLSRPVNCIGVSLAWRGRRQWVLPIGENKTSPMWILFAICFLFTEYRSYGTLRLSRVRLGTKETCKVLNCMLGMFAQDLTK